MPTTWPTTLDSFATKKVIDLEDAIQAIQAHLGTTAVPRDAVNAQGPPFYADPTFNANATPALQAAQDAAITAKRALYIPGGTYKLGVNGSGLPADQPPVYLDTGGYYFGDGMGRTVLKHANDPTASGYHALLWNKGRRAAMGGTGLGNTNIVVRDMTLDGNKGGVTSFVSDRHAMFLDYVDDFTISNVEVKDALTDGMVLSNSRRGLVLGCRATGMLKSGFYSAGSDDIKWLGCHGKGNGSLGIGSSMVLALAWFNTVMGCTLEGDVAASILLARDSQYCSIIGNPGVEGIDTLGEDCGSGSAVFAANHPGRTGAYTAGVLHGAYNCTIAHNTVRVGGSRTHAGIRLNYSDGNKVDDNILKELNRHGIYIVGGNRNAITNNKVSRWSLGAASMSGILVSDAVGKTAHDNNVDGNQVWDEGQAGSYGIATASGGGGRHSAHPRPSQRR